MTSSGFQALSPILALSAFVVLQILGMRWVRRFSVLMSVLFGFLGGLMVLVGIEYGVFANSGLEPAEMLWRSLTNLIAYVLLGYGYFGFVGLVESARRTVMMREINRSKNGLSLDELLRLCSGRMMIETRLGKLLENGHIVLEDGRYRTANRLVLNLAKAVIAMKLLVFAKRSEFD